MSTFFWDEVLAKWLTVRKPAAPATVGPAPAAQLPAKRAHRRLVSLHDPYSWEAEQYRGLRHVIEQLGRGTGKKVVAVTSAGAGDGKTTTALNIAAALAEDPARRVLYIEADLRCGTAARYLGLDGAIVRGLVNALVDTGVGLADVAQVRHPSNLSIIPAGATPSGVYELLTSPRMESLFQEARASYDTVIVDTPPFVPVADCRVLARWVDGFVLVVSAHRTERELLEEALNLMEPDKLLGLVFNADDRALSPYYRKYYNALRRAARSSKGRAG